VEQRRAIPEVVVADFMSGIFNLGNHLLMPQCPFTDKKKGRLGIVLLKNLKDLRRKLRVRTIIEGKSNQGALSPNPINKVGRKSFEHAQSTQRLYREDPKPRHEQNTGYDHYRDHLCAPPTPASIASRIHALKALDLWDHLHAGHEY
jgi:hypothetical protein